MDWLKEICRSDCRIESLRQPCGVMIDGTMHTFATDSRLAVLVACGNRPVPAELKDRDRIEKLLNGPRESIGWTSAEAIAEWAGPLESSRLETCYDCGGDGQCQCPRCEDHHDCGTCKGSGEQDVGPDVREGWVGPLVLDRNLVARISGRLTGLCQVLTGRSVPSKEDKTSGIIEFRGHGWRVLVSALNRNGSAADGWPQLELSPAKE